MANSDTVEKDVTIECIAKEKCFDGSKIVNEGGVVTFVGKKSKLPAYLVEVTSK